MRRRRRAGARRAAPRRNPNPNPKRARARAPARGPGPTPRNSTTRRNHLALTSHTRENNGRASRISGKMEIHEPSFQRPQRRRPRAGRGNPPRAPRGDIAAVASRPGARERGMRWIPSGEYMYLYDKMDSKMCYVLEFCGFVMESIRDVSGGGGVRGVRMRAAAHQAALRVVAV